MFRILNPNKWSILEKSLNNKPNILLTQFSVIAILGALIQVINDIINFNSTAIILDLIIAFIFMVTVIINERKYHLISKFVFIVLGTGYIFIYAGVIPKSTGSYLVFFPILAVIFLIFSNEERQYKYYSVIYVLTLLFILEVTDYQPFGDINIIKNQSDDSSFQVNMLIAVFAMVFSMYNIDLISKQIDKVRLETLEELEEKNKELELANDELDHFVYSASHDLKAPLLSILGLINIAKYEVKDQAVLDYFIRIENRVERLTRFIKEVIEISRNTRTDINPEAVNLEDLLDEIIENNSYIDGIDKIQFKKNIHFHEPIFTDKSRLEVILNNLISNAIKYSDYNKPSSWVEIEAKIEQENLQIFIRDNGIGIPEDQQEKVFDMFYRGAESKEGSGLGLYIVKNMLVKLTGKFELNSKEGKGTEIKLVFPV